MAKLEHRDQADSTYRVTDGSNGAVHTKGVGSGAVASDGTVLDLGGALVMSYTAGVLQYIEVASGEDTYRQTFTYTGDDMTGVSAWTLVVV